MKEILDKLKGMDKKQLSEAVKQAKAYADTPQGKELVEKIKKGQNIITAFIKKWNDLMFSSMIYMTLPQCA